MDRRGGSSGGRKSVNFYKKVETEGKVSRGKLPGEKGYRCEKKFQWGGKDG